MDQEFTRPGPRQPDTVQIMNRFSKAVMCSSKVATNARDCILEAISKSPSGIAHLRGADLRGVDLSGLDLSGADLVEADLTGANLDGTKLPEPATEPA